MLRIRDLAPIKSTDWDSEDLFFPIDDGIPGAFARLSAGQDAALGDLWEAVCHQGTPNHASILLAPYLLALACDTSTPVEARAGCIRLLGGIVDGSWGNPLDVDAWGGESWLFRDTRPVVAEHRADLLKLACDADAAVVRRAAVVTLGRLAHPDPAIVQRLSERIDIEPDAGARVDLFLTLCVLARCDYLATIRVFAAGEDSPLARAAAVMRLHLDPLSATPTDLGRVLAWHPESDSGWHSETDDTAWDLSPIAVLVKSLRMRPDLVPPVLDAMRSMAGIRRGQLGGALVYSLFPDNNLNHAIAGLPRHDRDADSSASLEPGAARLSHHSR